ncbi:MAG: InlB B-repeat-containing protein, partial [Clostridia bacterium]|nr:InlB B-repeat-containing protein [Clostridia bacterium]
DVTIKDSVLECGTAANVQIQSNSDHTVTLDNVTTIQSRTNPTTYANNSLKSNVMFGFGVLVGPETSNNPKIVLKGDFKQYNWVNSSDANAVSDSYASAAISNAVGNNTYKHTINGTTHANMGIVYLNTYTADIVNQTGLPYQKGTISVSAVSGQVYSLTGATDDQIYYDTAAADRSTENDIYRPQFSFDSTLGGQKIPETEGSDEYCYNEGKTVRVLFPDGDTKELDLAGLVNIRKYAGQDPGLTITCKDASGNPVALSGNKLTLSQMQQYTVTYTANDTLFFDKDGEQISDSRAYSWDIKVSVSLKDKATKDAEFEFVADNQKMGWYSGVKQYIAFLGGLKIYDYIGENRYLRFDGDNDFSKVARIQTEYCGSQNHDVKVTVTLTDGGVITTQFLTRANSGGSTYTGSIKTKRVNNKDVIYFVNAGSTSNSSSTTTDAKWDVQYYKFTGNNGVEKTSAKQVFTSVSSSASTPSTNFGTTVRYTVNYDANGGSCGQTVGYATNNSTSVTLPTPSRSGYIFVGWYTAASGGTKAGGAGASYTPSGNITLYAQWGRPCTVSFNANGG